MDEARATLRSSETDLTKASIRSPIDGVVLARSVEPGQTVAASLQVTVLFTFGRKSSANGVAGGRGRSRRRPSARRAGRDLYRGCLSQPAISRQHQPSAVRFGNVDNVVSYKTILNVNNDDLSLRPGMTATAEIVTAERENVLLVPNAALRFTPPKPAANAQPSSGGGLLASLLPRPPRPQATKSDGNARQKRRATGVVLRGDQLGWIPVTVGQSDGRTTEVTGADLWGACR